MTSSQGPRGDRSHRGYRIGSVEIEE